MFYTVWKYIIHKDAQGSASPICTYTYPGSPPSPPPARSLPSDQKRAVDGQRQQAAALLLHSLIKPWGQGLLIQATHPYQPTKKKQPTRKTGGTKSQLWTAHSCGHFFRLSLAPSSVKAWDLDNWMYKKLFEDKLSKVLVATHFLPMAISYLRFSDCK